MKALSKNKKILIIALSIILVVGLSVGIYFAVDLNTAKYNLNPTKNLTYQYVEDLDGYEVSLGKASGRNVCIPETYNGKTVVGVSENGFKGSNILSLVYPSSSFGFGKGAFADCKKLKLVASKSAVSAKQNVAHAISNDIIEYIGVTEFVIGENSFFNCEDLEEVIFPNGLKVIGTGAFGCDSDITIPNLKKLTIPSSVEMIYGEAFMGCENLETIIFDDEENSQLSFLGMGAFFGTKWYDNLPEGATYIGKCLVEVRGEIASTFTVREGTETIGTYAFYNVTNKPNLTAIVFNEELKRIQHVAFQGFTGLTEITLPSSVESVDWYAFWACSNLATVNILGQNIKIFDRAFDGTAYATANPNYCNTYV